MFIYIKEEATNTILGRLADRTSIDDDLVGLPPRIRLSESSSEIVSQKSFWVGFIGLAAKSF